MKNETKIKSKWFVWAVFGCLFIWGLSGCTASGSDCSLDSDCSADQVCSSGGGVFFGGGICVDKDSEDKRDTGGVGSDVGDAGGNGEGVQDAENTDEQDIRLDPDTRDDQDTREDQDTQEPVDDGGAVEPSDADNGSDDGGVVETDVGVSGGLAIHFTHKPPAKTLSNKAAFSYQCKDDEGVNQACTYTCFVDVRFDELDDAVADADFGKWVECGDTHDFATPWAGSYTMKVRATDQKARTAEVSFSWRKDYVSWRMVSAGTQHTCAIGHKDNLWCWGYNGYGALGLGDKQNRKVPTQVRHTRGWLSVSVGDDHSCAVDDTKKLYCWGDNRRAQVGAEDSEELYLSPTLVKSSDARGWLSVSAGSVHTCGINDESGLECWGTGQDGQLGLRDAVTVKTPTTVMAMAALKWRSVTSGSKHSCGHVPGKALYCWGGNVEGALGDKTWKSTNVPIEVLGVDFGNEDEVSVSAGNWHTCALLKQELYCWGGNGFGQLGLQNYVTRINLPERVSETLFIQLSAGSGHTCAVDEKNALYCWGYDEYGQLGIGHKGIEEKVDAPVIVKSEVDEWQSVSAGLMHTCAIGGKDELWCWGINEDFQLGLGMDELMFSVPHKVRVHLD